MNYLELIGQQAKAAAPQVRLLDTEKKNHVLRQASRDLINNASVIIEANEKDMQRGRENGMSQGLLDRLLLTEERIAAIGEGLCQIASLDDPIG